MIVPRERLIFAAALIGAPALTLFGMAGAYAAIGGGVLLLLVGVVLLDAAISRKELHGLAALLPGRINLFKGRPGEIEVRVLNESKNARTLKLGLNLPPSIRAEQEEFRMQLPQGAEQAAIKWPCVPSERGSFRIPSTHLETASRWGFWSIRSRTDTNVEVRVFPDILTERKRVAMVFLRRRAFGIHAQRQVGKGRDFEKLREYLHGDPVEDVHWKATAKRSRPVTKVFQIERTQEVYVAIDCSRLTARTTEEEGLTRTTVLDRFLTAALLLGLATEQQGDHFGLITFSDRVHKVICARSGRSHFAVCRDTIYNLQPRLVTPDFDELCATVRVRLRKRALVIFLTALDDPLVAESFTRAAELIRRQHLVLVNMIEPGGVRPLFDRHAPAPENSRDLYEALAGHMAWQKLREIQKALDVRGVKFAVLPNEALARELLGQYLEVKQRQLL